MNTTKTLAWMCSLALALGCDTFDPPPKASIVDDDNGLMKRMPDQPLELSFSEPYRARSLRMKVVKAHFDAEGNLLDEQQPPQPFGEDLLLAYDGAHPEAALYASFEAFPDRLIVHPEKPFSWAAPFLVLIEPGLEDFDGHATVPRNRLPFTYGLTVGGPNSMPSGYYYFLMNVDYISTQIQVYAYFEVDQVGGTWRAIFTNANRRAALNSRPGCPACSSDDPICALYPSARCVKPTEKQTDLSQYLDFLPEPDPPDGYTFIADGFARDEADGSTAFGTQPFVIDVTIGQGNVNVRAEGTTVNGSFRPDPARPGHLIASGSIGVEVVKLNGVAGSSTQGQFTAMTLAAAEVAEVESFGYPIPNNLY